MSTFSEAIENYLKPVRWKCAGFLFCSTTDLLITVCTPEC